MEAGRKSEVRRTIFHELLTLDLNIGYVVPPLDHLKDETLVVLGESSDTTGNAMTVATYEVISDLEMYQRLTAELKKAFPDANARMRFTDSEKLPYLVGGDAWLTTVDWSYQGGNSVSFYPHQLDVGSFKDYPSDLVGGCRELCRKDMLSSTGMILLGILQYLRISGPFGLHLV
jgi:Cytochrome P450